MGVRVGIVGASGMGRYHVAWYLAEGCEVKAFVGSRPCTVKQTSELLHKTLGFEGHGYTAVDEMLAAERLDAVSVCSPSELHAEHIRNALDAQLHVLCEKPLVWSRGWRYDDLLAQGETLVDLAALRGKVLAVDIQYVALAHQYRSLHGTADSSPGMNSELFFELETFRGNRPPLEYTEVWAELAPHGLGVLQVLCPSHRLVAKSLRSSPERDRVRSQFDYESPDGDTCQVTLSLKTSKSPVVRRRFGINGDIVNIRASMSETGPMTILRRAGRNVVCEDPVHTSIKRFLAAIQGTGEPLVDGRFAVENLALQLAILRSMPEGGTRLAGSRGRARRQSASWERSHECR